MDYNSAALHIQRRDRDNDCCLMMCNLIANAGNILLTANLNKEVPVIRTKETGCPAVHQPLDDVLEQMCWVYAITTNESFGNRRQSRHIMLSVTVVGAQPISFQ